LFFRDRKGTTFKSIYQGIFDAKLQHFPKTKDEMSPDISPYTKFYKKNTNLIL